MLTFITDEKELKISNGVCGVYFYSQAMPLNHKKSLFMIDKVVNSKNIEFFAVDIDFFKTFIKRFKLESVPTTIAFLDGKEKDRIVGVCLTKPFEKMFRDLINGDLK